MFENIFQSNEIEYGIINGNNILVYIKSGRGGDIYGYRNKYLIMAEQINRNYGYSVFVASNPVEINHEDNIPLDMETIREKMPRTEEILAFGHSNGGQLLLTYAYKYPMIKRVLAVNAPLMINLHKTKRGIEMFNGKKMVAVYGDKDPSYDFIKLLESCESEKFGYAIIKNADHYFINMFEDFINLPMEYLL